MPMCCRICHWGPIIALTIIALISSFAIFCDLQWWPPTSPGGFINIFVFLCWNALTLVNFFNAAFMGPGHVPVAWKPEKAEDEKSLQYCEYCNAFKSPRSHHCRKCKRCVMKMDHHCPWINNCVGFKNHASFVAFLFFAPCGCIHAMCILIPSVYRALKTVGNLRYLVGSQAPIVILSINTFIGCIFAIGLAFGVTIAVGGLFVVQLKSILRNETGIESWIVEKADKDDSDDESREDFVFPYNLGWKTNFSQVFHWSRRPQLNGIWWPVKDGCDQFTLTREQIRQKEVKRARSVLYEIREHYSGAIFPITKGVCVCCCPPISDDPRIPLLPGDLVLVSRWRKRWLYGELVKRASGEGDTNHSKLGHKRGWFPRRCAVQAAMDLTASDDSSHMTSDNQSEAKKTN